MQLKWLNKRFLLILPALAGLVLAWAQYRREEVTRAVQVAVQGIETGDDLRAQSSLRNALHEPLLDAYVLQLSGLISARSVRLADLQPRKTGLSCRAATLRGIRLFESAKTISPNDDAIWHNLGWLYASIGYPELAQMHFAKSIHLASDDPFYHASFAYFLYAMRKDPQQAADRFRVAIELSPSIANTPLFTRFARDFPQLRNWAVKQATTNLESSYHQRPNPLTLAKLGKLNLIEGNLNQAGPQLMEALAALPALPRAWLNLGEYWVAKGEFARAQECFKKAAFLDATDPLPVQRLASLPQQPPLVKINILLSAAELHRQLGSDHSKRVWGLYRYPIRLGNDYLPYDILPASIEARSIDDTFSEVATTYQNLGLIQEAKSYAGRGETPTPECE